MQDIARAAEEHKVVVDQLAVATGDNAKLRREVGILRGAARGLNAQLTLRAAEQEETAHQLSQLLRQKEEWDARETLMQAELHQLKEQNAELERQKISSEEKLQEGLRQSEEQRMLLADEAKIAKDQLSNVVAGVTPILNVLAEDDAEVITAATSLDEVAQLSQLSWERLKRFTREASEHVGSHVLAVTRSHYPDIELPRLGKGLAAGTSAADGEKLRQESLETAKEMVKDIHIVS